MKNDLIQCLIKNIPYDIFNHEHPGCGLFFSVCSSPKSIYHQSYSFLNGNRIKAKNLTQVADTNYQTGDIGNIIANKFVFPVTTRINTKPCLKKLLHPIYIMNPFYK